MGSNGHFRKTGTWHTLVTSLERSPGRACLGQDAGSTEQSARGTWHIIVSASPSPLPTSSPITTHPHLRLDSLSPLHLLLN